MSGGKLVPKGQATQLANSGRMLRPYPRYKDSGVEWLGEIPAHWEVKRVRHAASKIGSGKTPSGGAEVYVPDGVMLLRSQNVHSSGLHLDDVAFIDSETDSEMAGSRVREGDVLLNITGASLGRCCVARLNGMAANVNQHVCVIRPRSRLLESRFLSASLGSNSGQAQIFNAEDGISRDALNSEQVGQLKAACPPLAEQRAIAAFLDRGTARIDALVTKNERLIELLQEKRTALITRAVTRGLDPDVPMKDSGVEWLGKIPGHWEVKPFTKYVVEKSDYRGKTPQKVASGVFLVTARNVRMGLIDYACSEEFVAQEEYDEIMRRGLPKTGDILFTTEAPLGNVALVDRERVALAQRIIRFRMSPTRFDSRFTLSAMMSIYFQAQLLTLSTGSTAEGLKASKLSMLRVVAPPLNEQRAIAAFLDRQTTKIDALISKVRQAIDLLKEYRTALISAAVTGKIDVREGAA